MISTNINFIVGNPLDEVRNGALELVKNDISDDNGDIWNENSNLVKLFSSTNNDNRSNLVCSTYIPSFMIPADFLHFLSSFLDRVLSVQILRHSSPDDQYLALILLESLESAALFIECFQSQPMNSIEPCLCSLYYVKSVYVCFEIFSANRTFPLTDRTYRGDANISCSDDSAFEQKNDETKNMNCSNSPLELSDLQKISLLFYPIVHLCQARNEGAVTAESVLITHPPYPPEEINCCVCLEPFHTTSPRSFTSCCKHISHINCISRLENPQCPVCRFQHDLSVYTPCAVCNWRGSHEEGEPGADLWVCLICGFPGCGPSHLNHMQEHYCSHLHAYAANVDSGRVWDFGGGGYVHRLILSKADTFEKDVSGGSRKTPSPSHLSPPPRGAGDITDSSLDSKDTHLVKIVEGQDPSYQNKVRPDGGFHDPPSDQALGGYSKAEALSQHYNNQLVWQLRIRKERFEGKLERLRALRRVKEGEGGGTGEAAEVVSLPRALETSLESERQRLHRLIETARIRLSKVHDQGAMLRALNQNLLMNAVELKGELQDAVRDLGEAKETYRRRISELERKVFALTQALDGEAKSDTRSEEGPK